MAEAFDRTFFKQFFLFALIIIGAFLIFFAVAFFGYGGDSEEIADGPASLKLVEPVGAVIVPAIR